MYTIGQFSKICRVSTKALRHYEKLGLITPARVEENLYRYFTGEQVILLKKISLFKEMGLPLKSIKELLAQDMEPEHINSLLEEHRRNLLRELDLCNSRLIRLAWWKNQMEALEMGEKKNYDVRLKDIPDINVRAERRQMINFPQELPDLIRSVLAEIESAGGVCAGAPILLYYGEEFNQELVDVEVCWPVLDKKLANKTLPAVTAAATIHVGPYDGLNEAYQAVFDWVNSNGYKVVTPIREISCNDPQTTPPEQLVTEIIFPVTKQVS